MPLEKIQLVLLEDHLLRQVEEQLLNTFEFLLPGRYRQVEVTQILLQDVPFAVQSLYLLLPAIKLQPGLLQALLEQ